MEAYEKATKALLDIHKENILLKQELLELKQNTKLEKPKAENFEEGELLKPYLVDIFNIFFEENIKRRWLYKSPKLEDETLTLSEWIDTLVNDFRDQLSQPYLSPNQLKQILLELLEPIYEKELEENE